MEAKNDFLEVLFRIYKKLFEREPKDLEMWQVAEAIAENVSEAFGLVDFDSEDLRRGLTIIINNNSLVDFPDDVTMRRVVLVAEEAYQEIFFPGRRGKELHMAEIEFLGYQNN